jgi:hypothetical protein
MPLLYARSSCALWHPHICENSWRRVLRTALRYGQIGVMTPTTENADMNRDDRILDMSILIATFLVVAVFMCIKLA